MEILIGVLLGLLLLLTVVTLVGHGIWLLLAWMFRRPRKATPAAPPAITQAQPWADTLGRVGSLLYQGLIDSATYEAVKAAIDQVEQTPERPPPMPVLPAEPDATLTIDESKADEAAIPLPPIAEIGDAAASSEPSSGLEPPVEGEHAPPPLPVLPVRQSRPRRPLSEVLASFMERSNIRWGELVGGLLIIGCSVALVLSFWAQIQERPLIKFSVFTAVTAALFAVGLYSEHRWKLPTTSRGILLISTLLVPLNFLAFAAFSRGTPATDPVALGGEAIAFTLFFFLVFSSARVIAPQWPWLIVAGVMLLSVASLAVGDLSPAGAATSVAGVTAWGRGFWLAVAVVAIYDAVGAIMLGRAARWRKIDADSAGAMLLLLGVVSFAAVFPLALICSRSGDMAGTIHRLAPLLGLAGLPSLAVGMLLWRRVDDPVAGRLRATGTGVGIIGTLTLLGGIALSWPSAGGMFAGALISFVALLTIALLLREPIAHAPALVCGAWAYVLAFHLAAGHVAWHGDSPLLIVVLLRQSSGVALAGFVLALLGAAQALRSSKRLADARALLIAAVLAAGVSIILLGYRSLNADANPWMGTGVLALYGGLCFIGALRIRPEFSPLIVSAGWGLVLAASTQPLIIARAPADQWPPYFLALATVMLAVLLLLQRAGPDLKGRSAPSTRGWLIAISLAAAALVLLQLLILPTQTIAIRAAWMGAVWVLASGLEESVFFLNMAQAASALATTGVIVALLGRPGDLHVWFPAHG